MGSPATDDGGFAAVFLTGIAVLLVLYVVPIVIAFARRHPNRWLIVILTVVFGATLLGWLLALIWALNWEHIEDRPWDWRDDDDLERYDDDDRREPWRYPHRLRVATWDRDGDYGSSAEDSGSRPGVPWATAEIERLVRLREQNHIDAGEYQRLKADVLRRMQ